MLLKVGELAKRAGLTVRTLHHYDEIGLLKPSERSDSGHRLYNRDDIAHLHAIQALQQIGLPLNKIGELLSEKSEPMSVVIQRQVVMLERQIAQASDLCERLKLMQGKLVKGNEPSMEDWLSTLSAMSAYGRHFTAAEIKKIFENWDQVKAKMRPIIVDVRDAMARGLTHDSIEVQPLVRRWMDLSHRWMRGDFDLMWRWQKMYMQEPAAQGKTGVDLDMAKYLAKAIEFRMNRLLKYFTKDELSRFNVSLEDEWNALAGELRTLMRRKAPLSGKKTQDAVCRWSDLIDRAVNFDPVMRQKLLNAHAGDPYLRAGTVLGPELIDFVKSAWVSNMKKSA